MSVYRTIGPTLVIFIVVVILGHNLGNSQVSVYRTICSFSYLQVTMTCMTAWRISNFNLIGPSTTELAALESLKKIPIGL